MPLSLFNSEVKTSIIQRLDKLTAETKPQWGKMNATEMLNHCSSQMQIVLGEKDIKVPFLLTLFGIGKMIKNNVLADKPTPKNSRTAKELLPTDVASFDQEKTKFLDLLNRFSANEQSLEGKKHPLFGVMTSDEYGKITWNHIDYHFGQFGL